MKLGKNLQIGLILVAFLATVAILFSGRALATKFQVDQPLAKELKQIKAVEQFKLTNEANGISVYLKVKQVKNLQEVLDEVKQKVERYEHKTVSDIKLACNPDQTLKDIQYQLIFYLEEATVSGRYTQLLKALDTFDGVTAKVYLTNEYIYLQLDNGANYLYQAIPRTAKLLPQSAVSGGDAS